MTINNYNTDFVQVVEDPFLKELTALINRYSKENGSNTADFQLARYLLGCLDLFDQTVRFREAWYGRNPAQSPARGLSMPEPQAVVGIGYTSPEVGYIAPQNT